MPESIQPLFSSQCSIAGTIERLLMSARIRVDAAMYRITNPRLVRALGQVQNRGRQVRLLVDQNKYHQTVVTRELLAENGLAFHAISGRTEEGSKLHHKFVVIDNDIVLTGSYNWTIESEERNFDHMLILRDATLVQSYEQEFERLWCIGPAGSAP